MYHVVLLIEQELSELDATQITSLHEGIDEQVVYHVLLPVEDPSGQVEATLGNLAASDTLSNIPLTPDVDTPGPGHGRGRFAAARRRSARPT